MFVPLHLFIYFYFFLPYLQLSNRAAARLPHSTTVSTLMHNLDQRVEVTAGMIDV